MKPYQIVQTTPPPGVIDLGLGNPDPSLLPLELIRQSASAYSERGERLSLQYGLEQGSAHFRQALAAFLTHGYAQDTDPRQLFVTSGASSALDLLCTLYTAPGDAVLVEEPTYYLALRIFADHQLRSIPVSGEDQDAFIENLEHSLREYHPRLLYLIPTFQNPSGRTYSQLQRERIITLAESFAVMLVADEVYHLLWYRQPPPPPFASYTSAAQQAVSLGSFSKILAPGLRLGWIQAGPTVISKLSGSGLLDSGGGLNPFTSALVTPLLENGGLEENIRNLRHAYAHRLQLLAGALRRDLPQAEWCEPQGGFFVWARLPGIDAAEFRQHAVEFKVDLRQGALFSSQGALQDCFRLSFSYYPAEEIEEGIRRIGDCYASFQDQVDRAVDN